MEGRAFLGGPRLASRAAVLLPGVLLPAGSSAPPYAVLWCPFLTNANPIRHILAGRASLAGRAALRETDHESSRARRALRIAQEALNMFIFTVQREGKRFLIRPRLQPVRAVMM